MATESRNSHSITATLLGVVAMLFAVPAVSEAETYIFVLSWGSQGSGDGQFIWPNGIAVDSSGNVYVADSYNHRIQKFDSSGNFLAKWGSQGSGDGQFDRPQSIAFDSSGNICVTDTFNYRVQKFNSNGNFLAKWGSQGSGDGQFDAPDGDIAVDSFDNVYVTDPYNDRIQKFDSDGNFITIWGSRGTGEGEFSLPRGIALDSSGDVYVSDFGNFRVQKFDSDGNFMMEWGSRGDGDGEFEFPRGIEVDASGNVYVADTNNDRIQKFSPEPASVTYEGDTLLSTQGAATVDALLAATLRDSDGAVCEIYGEEVTFTLSAEGVTTREVSATTVAGVAAAIEPLPPAIYDIDVTLVSWAATTTAILVVYNPEGGFATGGGWIVPGNDGLNSLPNVRANFGFNAKYKQGASAGHLEFRYTNGFIDLKSDSVDLLVITGGKIAQFKGYATVNGEPGHWYFVKAIDNGEPGVADTFEIKIWAPEMNPDVDEQWHRAGGTLQGGNIVVHAK